MLPSKPSEPLDFGSVSRSRSTSISSDGQLPRIHLLVPPPVTPQPAFIAAAAASQIITTDQEFNTADFVGDDHDDGTAGPGSSSAGALVSPSALANLNGFLDHLLYNILAVSKSTQLSCIRPAVSDVLKPRLAREVVSAADDELSEYMGGEGDEQFDFRGGQEPAGEFDLIRSWKRTRLRCMVYTRLGDMEEDDEDEYIARDGLGETESAPRRFASHVDNVTPAAAIFLTSIIEYLGEQALVIAGETSRSRLSSKLNVDHDEVTESGTERSRMDRLVVEDYDMEKLAMNATLGRLWRTWRKRIRSPNLSRTLSRESFRRRGISSTLASSRKSSVATIDEQPARSVTSFADTETQEAEVDPASIPLPMSEHDVPEILIPGFSADPAVGEVQTMEAVVAHKVRPRSLMVIPSPTRSSSSASSSPAESQRPRLNRHGRSRSLPNHSYFPDVMPAADDIAASKEAAPEPQQPVEQLSSPTPSEERQRLETMYEQEEPTDSQTGLAISTPTAEEFTKEPSGKKIGNRNSTALSLSGASVLVEVSRPGSAQTTTASMNDETQHNTEVIEGQGTCEKPRPVSAIQRPRRKASGEPSRKSTPSSSRSSSGQVVPMVLEDASQTQKPDDSTTSAQKVADEPKPSDADKQLGNHPAASQTWFLNDDEGAASESEQQPAEPANTDRVASPSADRASVQRIPGRPTSLTPSKSRRSDSISDKRPATSGSGTSQVSTKLKGLIGKSPQGESARVRSPDEAGRQSTGGKNSPKLETLIQSDETIHYTLTPKSMREMEVSIFASAHKGDENITTDLPLQEPDSPRWRGNRSSTADLVDFLKTTAPPGDEGPQPGRPKPSNRKLPKHQPIIEAPTGLSSAKPNAGLARDAKPAGGSTRDFAAFIKSSGPPGDTPKSPAPQSTKSRRLSDATDLSKRFTRPGSGVSSSTKGTSGSKLQARSATTPKGEQTSELIDFIREGPPTPGSHRIPRTVAPFRNTMDSDDMNNQTSRASTPERSTADKSQTSRTGLLESTNRTNAQTKTPAPSSVPTGKKNEFDDPMPARKQRRVPDPYAIDDDDDEDLEELLGLQEKKPPREEESLIDFLRNVPPPPSEDTPPQPLATSAPSKSGSSLSSASAMKNRLLRGPAEKAPASKPSKSSLRSNQSTGPSNYATKVGMERSGNRPAQAAVHVTHGTPPQSATTPKRETETSSLADFLRNTGPPEPPRAPSALAGNKAKDGSGISRFLMRRKKVEA